MWHSWASEPVPIIDSGSPYHCRLTTLLGPDVSAVLGGKASFGERKVKVSRENTLPLSSQGLSAVLTVKTRGFPGGARGKDPVCQCRRCGLETSVPGWGRSLEEGVATHSSILAWRIPWIEKSGGLRSMGSQRVRNA